MGAAGEAPAIDGMESQLTHVRWFSGASSRVFGRSASLDGPTDGITPPNRHRDALLLIAVNMHHPWTSRGECSQSYSRITDHVVNYNYFFDVDDGW